MNEQMTRRGFLARGTAIGGTAIGSGAILAAASGRTAIAAAEADASAHSGQGGPLKKALLWGMLPGSMPVMDRFKLAADLGYDGIEGMATDDDKLVDEMRKASEQTRLPIHSVMNMAHWKNPLSSDKSEVVQAGLDGMKRSIANAKAWGADTILLVPAVVNAETRYKDAYTRSQKVIREQVLPMAREDDVVIAVENVWNKFLLSPLEFARYIDEFKDPHLMAYFDIGNNVQYAFPEDWILTLGPRIKKMHLKDFKRSNNQFVPLREGDVNWPAVRKAIKEIGYRGFLTAELPGGDAEYLKEVAKRIDLIFEGK